MALAGMDLGTDEVELLPILRQADFRDLPPPRRQLTCGRVRLRSVDRVQMHPTVAFRQEPQVLFVGGKPERLARAEAADVADPRVVMQRVDDS